MKRWIALVGMVACAKAPVSTAPAPEEPAAVAVEVVGPRTPAESAMRVALAEAKLAQSEGGRMVWEAMEAHGGLLAWVSGGTLAFSYDVNQIERPDMHLWTDVQADLWSLRVRQTELGPDADAVLGFDGQQVWISPGPDAFPVAADAVARTAVQMVAIPFVFADGDATFEVLGPRTLDVTRYDVVQVTRGPTDPVSPDHVFTLYLHPISRHVEALEITWLGRTVFVRVETLKQVGDVVVGTHLHVHEVDAFTRAIGPIITDVRAGSVRLGGTWPASIFEAPAGAHRYPPFTGSQPASE